MANMSLFQSLRKEIASANSLSNFLNIIAAYDGYRSLTRNQILGLKNEYRALNYLRNRFTNLDFRLSDSFEDAKGIDIVDSKGRTFQVGSHKQTFTTDYYVRVIHERNRIYLYKAG